MYQPEIKEFKEIRIVTLIIRKKKIRADIRSDLMYNKDILIVNIQEKTKKEK